MFHINFDVWPLLFLWTDDDQERNVSSGWNRSSWKAGPLFWTEQYATRLGLCNNKQLYGTICTCWPVYCKVCKLQTHFCKAGYSQSMFCTVMSAKWIHRWHCNFVCKCRPTWLFQNPADIFPRVFILSKHFLPIWRDLLRHTISLVANIFYIYI